MEVKIVKFNLKKTGNISARDRIILSAKARFARAGFEGTSTRQIAEDAGVAQSLLAYHFNSKDALWRSVMNEIFQIASEYEVFSTPSLELDIEERLMTGVENFIAFCAEDPDLHRLMTLEGRTKSDRLKWLVETHLRRLFEPACEMIKEGQKSGIIRDADPTLLYYSIIAIAGTMFSFEPEMSLLNKDNKAQDRKAIRAIIKTILFPHS